VCARTYSVVPALEDPLSVPPSVMLVSGSSVDELVEVVELVEGVEPVDPVVSAVPVVGASVVSGASVDDPVVAVAGPALAALPRPQPPKSASTSLPSRWQQPSAAQA
jgi:hypothetical protein